MKKYHVDRKTLIFISLFIFGAIASLVLYPRYTDGDQLHYRLFYDNVSSVSGWAEKFVFYRSTVGAAEPGYFFLVYLISETFQKDVFFSLVNGVGLGCFFLLLYKSKLPWYLYPFLLVNLYLISLGFSAERLKLAFVIFGLAFLFKPGIYRWVTLFSSVLFHFQMVIILTSYALWVYSGTLKLSFYWALRTLILLLVVISSAYAIYPIYSDYLIDKKEAYDSVGWGGASAMVKPAVFLVASAFCASNISRFTLASAPILLASFYVGSERVTVFSYFTLLFMVGGARQPYKGIFGVFLLLISAYFTYSGYLFLVDFVTTGKGGV